MLNVVLASDNNYAPFLGVAITSLIKNNQNDFDKINIFILDDEISSKNKKRIEDLIDNPNHVLNFIKTKNLDDLNVNLVGIDRDFNTNSFAAYSRLFITSLLPKDIDKIIYLDCDALIVDSFKELWDVDIDDYYCGAVLTFQPFVKKYMNFKLEDNYINSGFLLINLKKWRKNNVEEKFIHFMVENQNKFYNEDQGILNNVLKDQFLILHPKYNLTTVFHTLDYDLAKKHRGVKDEYYSKKIINQAKENPTFLHFSGGEYDRPWYNKYHPYRELYKNYCELAGFKDEIIKDYELPLNCKLFYKSRTNPFIRFAIKLIPNYLAYKRAEKYAILDIEKNNKKIKQMTENK